MLACDPSLRGTAILGAYNVGMHAARVVRMLVMALI